MSYSITQRKNKKGTTYQVTLEHGTDKATGKRVRTYKTFKSREAAIAYAEKKVDQTKIGVTPKTPEESDKTISQLSKEWLDYHKDDVKRYTYAGYCTNVNRYIVPKIGKRKVQGFKKLDVQDFIKSLTKDDKLSPRYVKNIYCTINQIFEYGVDLEIIEKNPCHKIRLPKLNKIVFDTYNLAEMKKLIEVSKGTSLETPIMIEAYTGLRRGELLALRWTDIDFVNKSIRVERNLECIKGVRTEITPKTDSSIRTISIPDELVNYLQALKKKSARKSLVKKPKTDLIIHNKKGLAMNPSTLSSAFGKLLKETGMKRIRFHDLIHSHATILLEEYGLSIKAISERLGHSDVLVTMNLYISGTTKSQIKALNAFQMAIISPSAA